MRAKRYAFPDRLLSVDEAAALLGISRRTLERKTANGRIPVTRPAGARKAKYRLYTLMEVMERDERRLA